MRSPGVDWGELRPSRDCRWEEDDEGVTLLVPRFGRGRVGRVMDRLFHLRPFKLRLDAVGAFAWRRCDGSVSVAEIAAAMQDEFGGAVEPVEERLVMFLTGLLREKFISLGE